MHSYMIFEFRSGKNFLKKGHPEHVPDTPVFPSLSFPLFLGSGAPFPSFLHSTAVHSIKCLSSVAQLMQCFTVHKSVLKLTQSHQG